MIQETRSTELSKPISKAAALEKRVESVDIAKGIGIVLVVMGHNDFALISPFAHELIYSFHMPMFFFMSGMFFRPDMPFWTFEFNLLGKDFTLYGLPFSIDIAVVIGASRLALTSVQEYWAGIAHHPYFSGPNSGLLGTKASLRN